MAVVMEEKEFNHVLRILGTNVEGRQKAPYALTKIRGIGRRYAFQVCKSADIDVNKRAGELTKDEVGRLMEVINDPNEFKIPKWFMNRKRDLVTGETKQVFSNPLDMVLREDLNRLKKIKSHRGIRHYWGLKVRGQHTCTTGRGGRTVGIKKH
eukprot:TRINITY_DN146_c0_g2_i1.p1 TRINITY_DN146_c0_g2~~TRINITY_DN146_c0_g2_i1.p1  ORF type:complete len:153 (-),score=38.16 TRINITY_DN146_c0_g2_i1:160-618(-)